MNRKLKALRAAGNFEKVAEIMKKIVQKDLRMVDISDFMIFTIEPDRPTWGTTHEFVQAIQQRKPVYIVIEDRMKTPLWFLRYIPAGYVFESHKELIRHLRMIHQGKVKVDQTRWKILLDIYRCSDIMAPYA
jgi:nucleoside 2-deoxyribosyltransferase